MALWSILFALVGCQWQTPPQERSAGAAVDDRAAQPVAVAPHEPIDAPGLPPPSALPRTHARHLPRGPALDPISSDVLRPFVGSDHVPTLMLQRLARARPRSMKPVGSTSTVFKVDLSGSIDAAFKSSTEDRPAGPAAEIAAYRLSRCLGLRNVPPAVSREVALDDIEALLVPEARAEWPLIRRRLVVTEHRTVWMAAIYWVPDLVPLDIDTGPGIDRFTGWLSLDGELPEPSWELAAHISTMLAWDYLIGNFDRFSGSNAQGTPGGGVVVLRDHDVAFSPRLGEELHQRILGRMLRAERFSRSFVAALRALTPAKFRAELSRDPAWVNGPLVSEQAMRGVFDRRGTILSHIDSLIALHGETAVLVFE